MKPIIANWKGKEKADKQLTLIDDEQEHQRNRPNQNFNTKIPFVFSFLPEAREQRESTQLQQRHSVGLPRRKSTKKEMRKTQGETIARTADVMSAKCAGDLREVKPVESAAEQNDKSGMNYGKESHRSSHRRRLWKQGIEWGTWWGSRKWCPQERNSLGAAGLMVNGWSS